MIQSKTVCTATGQAKPLSCCICGSDFPPDDYLPKVSHRFCMGSTFSWLFSRCPHGVLTVFSRLASLPRNGGADVLSFDCCGGYQNLVTTHREEPTEQTGCFRFYQLLKATEFWGNYIEDFRASLLCSFVYSFTPCKQMQQNLTLYGWGQGEASLLVRWAFSKRGLCGLGSFQKLLSKAKHRHKLPQP